MKEIKLRNSPHGKNNHGNHIIKPPPVKQAWECQSENNHSVKSHSEDCSDAVQKTAQDKANSNTSPSKVTENELSSKSTEIVIPQIVRRTSDYFLTGSWPRGILKIRSRCLSDSQIDFKSLSTPGTDIYCNAFSSSFECEDEYLAEEEHQEDEGKFEQETGEEGEDGGESSSTKKSVRFNDYVCKQVFRANASILGQRAKNQKKARQKKRSRERKLSEEGSQSSETETFTDHSDLATTEEDSSVEAEVVKRKDVPNQHSHPVRTKAHSQKSKKKGHKAGGNNRHKNNRKTLLNLSNEMVFQLDEV